MVKMKSSTNLQLHYRAEKEYHSLSRKICQFIVAVSITIFQFGSCQVSQAQDFWEELKIPDSVDVVSIAINDQQDIYIGSNKGVYASNAEGENW